MAQGKVLGVSASLRNARRGLGNADLIEDLKAIPGEPELMAYLEQEALTHLKNFQEAGRDDHAPFDVMYKNLRQLKGHKGLSNSEVALAAALWSAYQLKSDIDHLSLSEYFSEKEGLRNEAELRRKILSADGILISTPVYFGDRSSLVQSFVDFLREDKELAPHLFRKVYGGLAVGAKRNGGQETTLIYQLWDMLNAGMLGVGNDSETTSQYGGTSLAGDVGTISKDTYGLNTAMGTGRRVARVTQMLRLGQEYRLKDKLKVIFLILQDKDNVARDLVQRLGSSFEDDVDAVIIDASQKSVIRCLACDICPTHVDLDEHYRCIIKTQKDDMQDLHPLLIDADAIIPVTYSPSRRDDLHSRYQQFMERTRYLRRGDYVFSDLLVAPLAIEDVGAQESMAIRMMTSMLRHHTVLLRPLVLYRQNGQFINRDDIDAGMKHFIAEAKRVTQGRLIAYSSTINHIKYQPVGYVLSTAKDHEDEKLGRRERMIESRIQKVNSLRHERLSKRESC